MIVTEEKWSTQSTTHPSTPYITYGLGWDWTWPAQWQQITHHLNHGMAKVFRRSGDSKYSNTRTKQLHNDSNNTKLKHVWSGSLNVKVQKKKRENRDVSNIALMWLNSQRWRLITNSMVADHLNTWNYGENNNKEQLDPVILTVCMGRGETSFQSHKMIMHDQYFLQNISHCHINTMVLHTCLLLTLWHQN